METDRFTITYIDDMSMNNYKGYISELRNNINKVMNIASLNLSSAAKIIGISRLTLRRFLTTDKTGTGHDEIHFATASKFNNFIYEIYEQYKKANRLLTNV